MTMMMDPAMIPHLRPYFWLNHGAMGTAMMEPSW